MNEWLIPTTIETFLKETLQVTDVNSTRSEEPIILAFLGRQYDSQTIEDAIRFIEQSDDDGQIKPLDRYEIAVRFSNGDSIRGSFGHKVHAVEFVRNYLPDSDGDLA